MRIFGLKTIQTVSSGYDVVAQTAAFDQTWVGTEVRDYYDTQWGGTPPYEGTYTNNLQLRVIHTHLQCYIFTDSVNPGVLNNI
jgi:hypothetical protein